MAVIGVITVSPSERKESKMAQIEPDVPEVDDALQVPDLGPCTEEDRFLNTRGASLNYVLHMIQSSGVFCSDRDSLKGTD
jgi:hypothetical protein